MSPLWSVLCQHFDTFCFYIWKKLRKTITLCQSKFRILHVSIVYIIKYDTIITSVFCHRIRITLLTKNFHNFIWLFETSVSGFPVGGCTYALLLRSACSTLWYYYHLARTPLLPPPPPYARRLLQALNVSRFFRGVVHTANVYSFLLVRLVQVV